MRLLLRFHPVRLLCGPALLFSLLAAPFSALAADARPTSAFAAVHQRALQAFQLLHKRLPTAEADWQTKQPGIHMLLGLDETLPGETPARRAQIYLHANEALLGVPESELRALAPRVSRQRTVLRFQQVATLGQTELPVLDAQVTLTFDNANGQLLRVVSALMPVEHLVRGVITREDAVAKASYAAAGATFARGSAAAAEEAVLAGREGSAASEAARHVWIVHVPGRSPRDLITLAVDAQTGAVTRMPNRVMD